MFRWRLAQFFEIRWWQRYLAGRDKETYLDWKRAYWKNFLVQSGIELKPGAAILDAGCGPAGIFTILNAYRVDGVDPLLDRYDQKLPLFNPADYPYVRFFNEPLETFPVENQYDTVFCLNAINHVADLNLCLERLMALTRPGGVLALSVDAHNYSLVKKIFRLFPGDVLHPHQYGLDEYRNMLTAGGGKVVREVLIRKAGVFNYWLLVVRTRI